MGDATGTAPGQVGRTLLGDDGCRRRGRARVWLLTAVVSLALAIIGLVTYLSVRGHMIASLSEKLLTIQNSQEAAVRLWQDNERASVRGWADEPDLRAAVLELVDDDGGRTGSDGDARSRIKEGLEGLLSAERAIAYLVADPEENIVAASVEAVVGRPMAPRAIGLLRSVLAGNAEVSTPFVIRDPYYEELLVADRPVVVKSAPVRNRDGEVVAALIVAVHPSEFGDLVDLARFGESGETYAVNPEGWILSRTRKTDQLKQIGLISAEAAATSVYAFQVRDPGGDMTRGFRPTLPAAGLPLTLAAASVIGGDAGIELEGYRDFRGVRVVGTWRWLDDLDLGLITELDDREAMAPLRPLLVAFVSLFGIAVLTAIGLIVYARIVQRLRRRIAETTQLGQYTLIEKIGEGGMGKVYRARHRLLHRDTAVKLLKPDVMSEEAIVRFEQEVQLTAQLRHPNTVQIYDFGRTPEGIFYYAMEYLDGYDLSRMIDVSGSLAPARVVHILRQACRSLREAHAAGLIHRDIKPMNLIVSALGGEFDVVKVLDFGLVKDVRVPDRGMTELNVIPGTPPYIAPERMKPGFPLDGRADIYSLGAVAFNMLTGEQAFEGDTALDIAYKAMHEEPRRPSAVAGNRIPTALDDLVLATLARDPDDRPANVNDLLARLDDIAAQLPWNVTMAAAWWAAHPPPAGAASEQDRELERAVPGPAPG